jgi:sensor histidine kinase YesM
VERLVKFTGIPLFTIFSMAFISPFPITLETNHLLFHLIFSFIGVISIWYSIRYLIFFTRKNLTQANFGLRLSFQLVITSVVALAIIWILEKIGGKFFFEQLDFCCGYDKFDEKNLYLISIIFAFLINTIYESFYLFLRLSETAIDSERYKKESAEARYQNLTSRLNPHFLFNSFNTLTTVVEEDPQKAVNYIKELSIVYRYVLSGQKLTWADLAAELKFTESYISLLKMRFEENLRVHMDICKDFLNYHILPMTLQLLIENAVKHNEISDSHPLDIEIICSQEKIIVTNNKQKRTIMPSTTKVGLHNISERYRFLVNKKVIIEDTEKTFTVKIPLIKTIDTDREHIEDYL